MVLVSVTKVQEADPRARRGRGGFRTTDCQLREVLDVQRFCGPSDLADLLPRGLPRKFTTADIATAASISRDVAQQMAFCLRALHIITKVSRTKAGIYYSLA